MQRRSYMSYAKIASASGFSDMNLIIIKATAHDDLPLHEQYIQHLLKLLSISPSTCHSFAISFTRRFGTTRCWPAALKCLILLLHFKDDSSFSCLVPYTNFVISYARLLDEDLNCVALEDQEEEEANMDEMGRVLEMLPQLQSLIDRVMECYPVGVAAPSFIVQGAMKLIIRDSFVCYTKFRREIVAVLDNLLQMPYGNCIAAFNLYKKAAVQTNELYELCEWCKAWFVWYVRVPFGGPNSIHTNQGFGKLSEWHVAGDVVLLHHLPCNLLQKDK